MNLDYRISLRAIESKYGQGNFDDAGDDIVLAFRQATGPASHPCRFEFDRSHPNPWYHVLVFSVDGLSDAEHTSFNASLARIFDADSLCSITR